MIRLFTVKYPKGEIIKIRISNFGSRKDCLHSLRNSLRQNWNIKEADIIKEERPLNCKHCKGTGVIWKIIKRR